MKSVPALATIGFEGSLKPYAGLSRSYGALEIAGGAQEQRKSVRMANSLITGSRFVLLPPQVKKLRR